MAPVVFLKLGGSLITDKSTPYTPLPGVIERICAEIHEARTSEPISLLVGHGSGSYGHVSASRYRTHEGIVSDESWQGFVKVHEDAVKLNDIFTAALNDAGEIAYSIQPSATCLARDRRIIEFHTSTIQKLLSLKYIPVLFGDVCLDDEQGCCIISTEEIFRALAPVLEPARIILATKVEGVLDGQGRVIPTITRENIEEVRASLDRPEGVADVTGGMLDKVERALETGVPTEIVSGLVEGNVRRALLGETGLGSVIWGQAPPL